MTNILWFLNICLWQPNFFGVLRPHGTIYHILRAHSADELSKPDVSLSIPLSNWLWRLNVSLFLLDIM